ncbi:hypothetical protein MHLP_01625 [Candidatus Mycoplasma haematolamae str. Purdue]|uniref:Uncharacterized protein n=1 Tax=Mycoplasma haematolamae (strain Purdue) TaxID=1212765 RepID=I7B9F2_MYCHA|nr:hypothetical protein [Candidatus Mycoplasma haematolamae]AFO51905.1 hypothetical protein MHLP_01625 [Candidatus Mycoplasma haematolamae str. Purdue]
MAIPVLGKVAAAALVAGGTGTGVVYPLVKGNGSYVSFFTGKISKEVEGILLFTKSFYEDEQLRSTSDRSYRLDIKTPEDWGKLKSRWESESDRDATLYLSVEIRENNRSDQVTAFLTKMSKGIRDAIKENQDGEYKNLKRYLEKKEVIEEFKYVFGTDTYQSLVKSLEEVDKNSVKEVER